MKVKVFRWWNRLNSDWINVRDNEYSDLILLGRGYTSKIYQFDAFDNTSDLENPIPVFKWFHSKNKSWISVGEGKVSDEQLISMGYSFKTFQFYASQIMINDDELNIGVPIVSWWHERISTWLTIVDGELPVEHLKVLGFKKTFQFYAQRPRVAPFNHPEDLETMYLSQLKVGEIKLDVRLYTSQYWELVQVTPSLPDGWIHSTDNNSEYTYRYEYNNFGMKGNEVVPPGINGVLKGLPNFGVFSYSAHNVGGFSIGPIDIGGHYETIPYVGSSFKVIIKYWPAHIFDNEKKLLIEKPDRDKDESITYKTDETIGYAFPKTSSANYLGKSFFFNKPVKPTSAALGDLQSWIQLTTSAGRGAWQIHRIDQTLQIQFISSYQFSRIPLLTKLCEYLSKLPEWELITSQQKEDSLLIYCKEKLDAKIYESYLKSLFDIRSPQIQSSCSIM